MNEDTMTADVLIRTHECTVPTDHQPGQVYRVRHDLAGRVIINVYNPDGFSRIDLFVVHLDEDTFDVEGGYYTEDMVWRPTSLAGCTVRVIA